VDVNGSGAAFQSATPQQLFKTSAGLANWAVSGDGKKFLLTAPLAAGAPASRPYHVVVNWTELLKR
jgi:hypothetical protein